MKVQFIIGVLVMVSVMRCPPQGATLGSAGAQNSEDELGRATGLERFVGKVPVIESCNREHPHQEKRKRKPDGECACPRVKRQQTCQMKRYERDNPQKIE
tara:strand:+ start:1555 stop:1854 length:300 start_codon:yes stop_codon:yes gene_type:complete